MKAFLLKWIQRTCFVVAPVATICAIYFGVEYQKEASAMEFTAARANKLYKENITLKSKAENFATVLKKHCGMAMSMSDSKHPNSALTITVRHETQEKCLNIPESRYVYLDGWKLIP